MKNKGVVKSVAVVTVFSVITRILSFVFKVYISRSVGAEGVGVYQMALNILVMLLCVAGSGVPVVLSRLIASDDKGKTPSYLTSALIITISSSVLVIIFAILLKPIFEKIISDDRAVTLLYIMLPALISTSIYNVLRSWFWGRKSYAPFSFTEMFEEVSRIVCTLILCTFVTSISKTTSVAVGLLISDYLCAIALLIAFFINHGKMGKPQNMRGILYSSTPLTLTRIFSGITSAFSAIIIPIMLTKNGLTGSDATAMYGRVTGMALPLLMAPTTIIGALSVVLIPEIATLSKNDLGLSRRIESSILFTLSISALFTILYIPFGKDITALIFQDEISGQFLSVSALLLYPISLNQVSVSMLNSLGYEKKTFTHYILGASLMIISLIILPRYMGIYAIAISFLLCFMTTSILNLYTLNKNTSIFDNFKKPVLSIALSIPCIVIAFLFKNILEICPNPVKIIIGGGVPMALYVICILWFDILPKSVVLHHKAHKSS